MTRLWIHHDAVFLFVSNHKFKKFASCPPSWSKRHQYAYVAWWEIFASLPQVHPYFKWRGWSWDFLGFEIFDSRILLGSKNWQVYFWVAWFKTKTGKSKLKTTTKLIITFGWPYQPSSGLQITIYYLHVRVRMVRLRESCSETVMGLDLMSALSTGPLCSLNLSLRRRLISHILQRLHCAI